MVRVVEDKGALIKFQPPAGIDCIDVMQSKPNPITLASSELSPNMFGASSELVRSWLRTS